MRKQSCAGTQLRLASTAEAFESLMLRGAQTAGGGATLDSKGRRAGRDRAARGGGGALSQLARGATLSHQCGRDQFSLRLLLRRSRHVARAGAQPRCARESTEGAESAESRGKEFGGGGGSSGRGSACARETRSAPRGRKNERARWPGSLLTDTSLSARARARGRAGGGAFHTTDATCYVGNLDERVTDAMLWELFVQAGPLGAAPRPSDGARGAVLKT